MQNRLIITRLVKVLLLLAGLTVLYVLLSYLRGPETEPAAIEMAATEFIITPLKSGEVDRYQVNGRVLYLLKPSKEQWADIISLHQYTHDADITSYVAQHELFAYWGHSTRLDCALLHIPKGHRQAPEGWPGGYWDPVCEVSYDYAGRAIATEQYAYSRYVYPHDNLEPVQITGLQGQRLSLLYPVKSH